MSIKLKELILSIAIFALSFNAVAQVENLIKQENSPYSFFGLGNIQSNLHASNRAMAFTGNAVVSNKNINFKNPASLAALQYATLHTGFFYNAHFLRNALSTTNPSYVNNSANASIPYLSLSLPIVKNYNVAVGLMPYSRTSYNVLRNSSNPTLPDSLNLEQQQLLGEGDFYNFYIGNGYRTNLAESGFLKNYQLSAGFNAVYYFGSRQKVNITTFPLVEDILGFRATETLRLSDFAFDFGVILKRFNYETKKNSKGEDFEKVKNTFSIGATYSAQKNLKSFLFRRNESIFLNAINNVVVVDTSGNVIEDSIVNVTLPGKLGLGVNFNLNNRFNFAFDYTVTNWNNLKIFDEAQDLNQSREYNLGLKIIPKISFSSLNKFWARNTYYFGAYYNDGSISINDKNITDLGFTFGMGLPIFQGFQAKRLANVNVSFNYGSLGSLDEGIFRESYFKTIVGFTFNDANWFKRRKYN